MKLNIYGSLIQAYKICPRRSWLMTKNLIVNENYESFAIWRFITDTSYKNNKTKIETINSTLEIIKSENKTIISIETNQNLEIVESLVFQILYYIYVLKNNNIIGQIKIPKENKIIEVILTQNNRVELENLISEMVDTLTKKRPKRGNLIQYCKFCSYGEVCKELLYKDKIII